MGSDNYLPSTWDQMPEHLNYNAQYVWSIGNLLSK
jgi:hypothetical protein